MSNKQDETPPIIRWLHRRIFRGIGWVFLAGMLTLLYLFIQAGAKR